MEDQGWTVNKLKFDSLGIVGREAQVRQLQECFDRAFSSGDTANDSSSTTRTTTTKHNKNAANSPIKQLVLVRGAAGVGKTSLVVSTLRQAVKRYNKRARNQQLGNTQQPIQEENWGTVIKGKFDPYRREEPYMGIVRACQQMCGQLLLLRKAQPDRYNKIANCLATTLGSEVHLLRTMIPELTEALSGEDLVPENMGLFENQELRARFHYAFQLFFRVLSLYLAPLILVVDDLQWADESSLELLKLLLHDRENPSLFVVGIYRSTEVSESSALSRWIVEFQEEASLSHPRLQATEMEASEFSVEPINRILMHLMNCDDPEETMGLAELCFKRTHGNIFFLLTFIRMLTEQNLLECSLMAYKWQWKEEAIVEATKITENVAELVEGEMMRLSLGARRRLIVAGCFGHSFDKHLFDKVWKSYCEKEKFDSTPSEEDERIWVDGRYLEPSGDRFQWVHDKVMEAAMNLISKDELSHVKREVGKTLLRTVSDQNDSYIFTIADLLNDVDYCNPLSEEGNILMAEINLRAAKHAASVSAFTSTADYALIGIQNLPTDRWNKYTTP